MRRDPAERERLARRLMDAFAERTGLDSDHAPRRYLWTDALAVCVDLALHRRCEDPRHLQRALKLVDQVHHVLGRHREDDPRRGWISGLRERDGARRPTAGGLRIGKPLPERAPHEPPDPGVDWDRDGQYFHYLTRWMHALRRVWAATGERRFLNWARELARAAWRGFARAAPSGIRMCWKASIDLSQPVVPSMGLHDPLDGYVTFLAIRRDVRTVENGGTSLDEELEELAGLCEGRTWETDDPLGTGGLLEHACRLARIRQVRPAIPEPLRGHGLEVETLLSAAAFGVADFAETGTLEVGPNQRLAFRELGLVLGLQAVDRCPPALLPEPERNRAMIEAIRDFWLKPESQRARSWAEHEDINAVTLAAALAPDEALA